MLARFNLRALVREAIESTKSRRDAREKLVRQSSKDLALRQALVELAAIHAVATYYCTERSIAFKSEVSIANSARMSDFTPEVLQRRVERVNRRRFWHRYTLFGYCALADAKRLDLQESVAMRQQLANGNLKNAEFERSIIRRMKDDNKPVSRQLTAGQIEQLARKHKIGEQDEEE